MKQFFENLEDSEKIIFVDFVLRGIDMSAFDYQEIDDPFEFFEGPDFDEDDIYWGEKEVNDWEEEGDYYNEEEEEEQEEQEEMRLLGAPTQDNSIYPNLFRKYNQDNGNIFIEISSPTQKMLDRFLHDNVFIKGYIYGVTIPEKKPSWAFHEYFVIVNIVGTVFHEITYN